jgi:hypothetical protein
MPVRISHYSFYLSLHFVFQSYYSYVRVLMIVYCFPIFVCLHVPGPFATSICPMSFIICYLMHGGYVKTAGVSLYKFLCSQYDLFILQF